MPQYLGRLAANAATIINARDYEQTIYDLATRRQLIVIGEDMAKAAYDSPVDFPPKEQIEEVETRLFSLAETGKYGQGFQAFRDASNAAVAMALSARKRGGGISGLATGLCTLDAKTGGLQPSDLIILAGRPSMGKTALATNIAFNVARAGTAVGFFSLEMSKDQLATRMLSERIGVSSERIRRGNLKDEEARRLIEADRELSSIPLFIDQTGGISIAQLAARARRLKRQKGLGLVVVDYLQLLSGSSMTRGEGRVQVVSEITTGLKALAKELDVPILALSQLSRAVENREEKRPLLSDLRESGSIEQDADVVMFVFRQEYYLERSMPGDSDQVALATWRQKMAEVAGKAEVDIAKQRHGPIDRVLLQFDASITRFSDLTKTGYAAIRR